MIYDYPCYINIWYNIYHITYKIYNYIPYMIYVDIDIVLRYWHIWYDSRYIKRDILYISRDIKRYILYISRYWHIRYSYIILSYHTSYLMSTYYISYMCILLYHLYRIKVRGKIVRIRPVTPLLSFLSRFIRYKRFCKFLDHL